MKQSIKIILVILSLTSLIFFTGCDLFSTDDDTDNTIEYLPPVDLESGEFHFLGLDNQNVLCLEKHPHNPNIIYAGILSDFSRYSGKLIRSEDAGATWDTLLSEVSVYDIVIMPDNPDEIFISSDVNLRTPSGIYKTEDGGETWFRSDNGIVIYQGEMGPRHLEVDYYHNNLLYCSDFGFMGSRGVYISRDRGDSWDLLTEYNACDLYSSEHIAGLLYIGVEGKILRSSDYGENVQIIFESSELGLISDFAESKEDASILYLASSESGFWRSEDSGMTWEQINDGLDISPLDIYITTAMEIHRDRIYCASFADFGQISKLIASDMTSNEIWHPYNTHTFENPINDIQFLDSQHLLIACYPEGIHLLKI